MAQPIRICMLNADTPAPTVCAKRASTYGRIFHDLLSNAATNAKGSTEREIKIISTDFDVVKNEYPSSLDDFDAVIITGAAASSYDDRPWIHKLARWTKDTYENQPRVKIFGSCFGHQLICQTLLKDYGVKVEKDPNGLEVGVKEIVLHERFRKTLCNVSGDECSRQGKMRLQFIHRDHVVIPDLQKLPPSWMTVGNTEHCAVQGLYECGRVLTYQGHFEFDRFVNSETVKFFFPDWQPKVMEETLDAIDADDDAIEAARLVLRFFLEQGESRERSKHVVVEGLPTPLSQG